MPWTLCGRCWVRTKILDTFNKPIPAKPAATFLTSLLLSCILPAHNSVHKDAGGTARPCIQTARSHDATTYTEPSYALKKKHTPFGIRLRFTPAKPSQPQTRQQVQNDACCCLRPPARILSCPQTSDYRIHMHACLCLFSHGLHRCSIHKPVQALNEFGLFQSRSKLPMWPNRSLCRISGSIQELI